MAAAIQYVYENQDLNTSKPKMYSKKCENPCVNLQDLSFVKLKLPRLIPVSLIESVKAKTFTSDQFYDYQENQVKNPYNHLYALVDKVNKIHGYLWAESNLLDGSLFINTFSISKEYWGKGEAIDKATEFLRGLKEKIKATRVFWITTNEKFFLKKGFKRSKNVLMEYVCHPPS